jgi:hypothetical protein
LVVKGVCWKLNCCGLGNSCKKITIIKGMNRKIKEKKQPKNKYFSLVVSGEEIGKILIALAFFFFFGNLCLSILPKPETRCEIPEIIKNGIFKINRVTSPMKVKDKII